MPFVPQIENDLDLRNIDKLFTKGLERSILHCDQTINDHIDSDKSAQKDDGLVLNRSSYISDHKSITKQTTS